MQAISTTAAGVTPHGRAFTIAEGSLEALKWLALVVMTADHVNAYFFNWEIHALFDVGRLALPTFGFVFAYNLARPSMDFDRLARIIKRLVLFGVLATPAYIYRHGYWPFNVLFTLATFASLVYCMKKGNQLYVLAAILIFAFGGLFVEFWWFGLGYCLAAWHFCRRPTFGRGVLVVMTCATLSIINQSQYALLALLLIAGAAHIDLKVKRQKELFYWFYPAHLTALAIASWMYGNH